MPLHPAKSIYLYLVYCISGNRVYSPSHLFIMPIQNAPEILIPGFLSKHGEGEKGGFY
jgi:hypothetical protein